MTQIEALEYTMGLLGEMANQGVDEAQDALESVGDILNAKVRSRSRKRIRDIVDRMASNDPIVRAEARRVYLTL